MPLKRRAAPRAEMMGWDGSTWQRLPVESAANPNLRVKLYHRDTGAFVYGGTMDGRAATDMGLVTQTFLYGFNGSRWDRWRNNTEKTVLPSGTRTASGNSADQTNYNARGVMTWINVTAVSGSFAAGEGLKIVIEAKDPTSGAYWLLSPEIGPYTTTGVREILVYPGCTDTAGYFESENDIPLPRTWKIYYDITGTDPSFEFSVGVSYVV